MDAMRELTTISSGDQMVLTGLALLDATSMGTLALPAVLLLMSGRSRGVSARGIALRVLAYLAVIAVFYWMLGLVLLAGLQAALAPLGQLLEQRPGAVVLVVLGAGLAWLSWWLDPEQVRKRGGDPQASMRRWIDRADRVAGSWRGVGLLAMAAGLVEAVTMIPYLAAMAGIGRYDLGPVASGIVLGLYCAVMVLPAALLALGRLALGERVSRGVSSVRELAVRTAPDAAAWGLGIVGVILLVRGVGQLW
ncbi:GAP family protein [Kocuria palustris]|uniref:GAP family protein n=2 Tax=Kocuria palustris TaxID=71999 RepID=UPI0024690791|nr:GAP family protein [Kocuria palustris]MDH5151796.1 GAP family protein [Kocuria palustris]